MSAVAKVRARAANKNRSGVAFRYLGSRMAGASRPRSIAYATRSPLASRRGFYNSSPGKELKVLDTYMDSGVQRFTTGGSALVLLNGINQGDDITNRVGRQVTVKSVSVRGIIQPLDANTNTCFCRMMLVWDNSPNSPASIALVTDVLAAGGNAAGLAFGGINLNNRARFTILRDLMVPVGSVDGSTGFASGETNYIVNEFIPINRGPTTYSGTTSAIGSISTGALYAVFIGNQSGDTEGLFLGQARIRFTDA